MKTWEDLQAVGENDADRIDFIQKAVADYMAGPDYRAAIDAESYYRGENPTINRYEKIIYDAMGKAHIDMWTANHKIASHFFTMVIDQEVSYILGNGVRFGDEKTKDLLGEDFDETVADALEFARIAGASYGFWNVDHIDQFKATEFCPLYGEETGRLMAGIRWWQLAKDKPMRMTLFEPDGFTEFIKPDGENMEILKEKRAYVIHTTESEAEGVISTDGENYETLPIVPMYANKEHKSALHGKRNTLDALDLATSNMVNNVDEGNLIFWVLNNAGGMSDLDDAEFIRRVKTLHVVHGSTGAETATPQSIEAPFEGTQATIDMLINRLYDDFQAFNAAAVSASNQSATAIKASYIPLDLKMDKVERQLTRFINGILALAGIDDKPSYQRNQLINTQEATQTLIMQADYFDADYIREKLLAINGDIDMLDEINARMDAEDAKRLKDLEKALAEKEAGEGQEGAAPGGTEEGNE